MEDDTASDMEVECTLVGDENAHRLVGDENAHRLMLVERLAAQARW